MTAFNDHVLVWLKQHEPDAQAILAVDGQGTDWAGDTEGGFHEEFSVDIRYRTTAGREKHLVVAGDDMQELWTWTVGGWGGGQE